MQLGPYKTQSGASVELGADELRRGPSGEAHGSESRAGGGAGCGALALEALAMAHWPWRRWSAAWEVRDVAGRRREVRADGGRLGPAMEDGVLAMGCGRRWPTSGATSSLGSRRSCGSASDAASSLGSCGALLGGSVCAREVSEAVAGGGRWRPAAGGGGRRREQRRCSGGGVGAWERDTREREK
jgi:hypothetical protein